MSRTLHGYWLGRRPYARVHELQQALQEARQRGAVPDTVLLLEHEPVITLGRGAHPSHVLLPSAELAARGVAVEAVGRGGDVTLHAPGQLVGYPIINLAPERQDVRRFVGDLAAVMAEVAAGFGIAAGQVPDLIGLWVDASAPSAWPGAEAAVRLAKLGAIGVRVSRWVTMHGFALNLTNDLHAFSWIVPCGITQHGVTSVKELTGSAPEAAEVAPLAFQALVSRLEANAGPFVDCSALPLEELDAALGL